MSTVNLKVPEGMVGAALTGFPIRVDLSHMTSAWWEDVDTHGAGAIRVREGVTDLPVDLVLVDNTTQSGELFFKADLASDSDNEFTVEVVPFATEPAATDPIGRNAVWEDYLAVVIARGGLINRVDDAAVSTVGNLMPVQPKMSWTVIGPSSPQGVAWDDDGNIYASTSSVLYKYDSDGGLLASATGRTTASGIPGVNHLGDLCVYDGELYATLETYPDSPFDNVHIAVYALSDLSFVRSYDISAQLHEAASVCFNPDDGHFYVAAFSGSGTAASATHLFKYDTSFNFVGAVATPSVPSKQGITVGDGYFWATSESDACLYRWPVGATTGLELLGVRFGATGVQGLDYNHATGEIAIQGDGDGVKVFEPSDQIVTGGVGYVVVTPVTKSTVFTMAASYTNYYSQTGNHGIISYSDHSSSNSNRATLVDRSSNTVTLWASSGTFLSGGVDVPTWRRDRFNAYHDGTAGRGVYHDGTLVASGSSSARPAGSADGAFFIGAEDTTLSEGALGALDYVYLRAEVLSAEWVVAEVDSWENTASFYEIGGSGSGDAVPVETASEVSTVRPIAYVADGEPLLLPLGRATDTTTPRHFSWAGAGGSPDIDLGTAHEEDVARPLGVMFDEYELLFSGGGRLDISAREVGIQGLFSQTPDGDNRKDIKVLVVNQGGVVQAELSDAWVEDIVWTVAEHHSFNFKVPLTSPNISQVQTLLNEVQVWRGNQLLIWGVVTRAQDDGKVVTFQCQDLSFYLSRRLVGQVPKFNLLSGGINRTAGPWGWEYTSLPRSAPRNPPAKGWVFQPSYNEWRSLALSSSTGKNTVTLDNDNLFSGIELTSGGKTSLNTIINDTHAENPVLTVKVYDDNTGNRKAVQKRAEDRADAIAEYILGVKPGATVNVAAPGMKRPKKSNRTSGGRDANRRTTISYRDDDGRKGHKQCARQRLLVQNPRKNRKAVSITASCYVMVDNASGYAAGFRGMELVRENPRKGHKDPKWRKEGYKRVQEVQMVPISKENPLDTWVRMEATVRLPKNGRKSIIDLRLFPPNGDAYFSEIWLVKNDSLWFKEEEQADIIKAILEHAQDEEMGKSDLNIQYESTVQETGVERDREYVYSERQTILDLLDEFPTLANGVEWDIVCSPTERHFTTYFPRRGSDKNYVLADGSNIFNYGISSDGTLISTTVIVQSDADGPSREERSTQNSSVTDGLALEKAYTITPNSPASSWQKQADRGLARYRRPVHMPVVAIDPAYTDELMAEIDLGDTVLTNIGDSWIKTVERQRITQIKYTPSNDQLEYTLTPEDIGLELRSPLRKPVRYKSQAQNPIVGANGVRPVKSNPEYAGRSFDDSGWNTGNAPVGWVKEATGSKVKAAKATPATAIPAQHEVWIRKWVKVTGDMIVSTQLADWWFLYVNGNLVNPQHFTNRNVLGSLTHPHIIIPAGFLHPSGEQLVAAHVQYDPRRYSGSEMSSLIADFKVTGTYDERLIL